MSIPVSIAAWLPISLDALLGLRLSIAVSMLDDALLVAIKYRPQQALLGMP